MISSYPLYILSREICRGFAKPRENVASKKELSAVSSNGYNIMKPINYAQTLKLAIAAVLFLSFLLGLRWLWSDIFYEPEHPPVVQGTLDLRGWDFENSRSIALDGEWAFYPEALVTRETADRQPDSALRYVQVPGDWRDAMPGEPDDSYGYGTYRLRILVDPVPDRQFGFWMEEIEASSRVEINGRAEPSFGIIADSKQHYRPNKTSYTASYASDGAASIELFVQSANYDNPFKGGIVRSIRFGSQAAVDTERWYSIGFQLVMFIILLLHALYACLLYLFKPRETSLIVFFLLFLTVALSVVTSHDSLLMQWLPLDYAWEMKLTLLSYMWLSFFILVMSSRVSGQPLNKVLFRVYASGLAAYTGFILAAGAPLVYASRELHFFLFFYVFPLVWFVSLIVKMVARNKNDVVFPLLTVVGILSSVIWGMFGFLKTNTAIYYPIDVLAAIIVFSAYWFKRYFRNAEENAKLTEQLRESDKLKDQFLANTSHELRTPLHGIMNIARNVAEREKHAIGAQSAEDMELLVKISGRMSHLVDDLLDVVRLREKRIALRKEPLSVASVASGVVAMLRFMAEGKSVRLLTEVPESLPLVLADEKRLVQILFNLVHNALKYTDAGKVEVSAEIRNGQAVVCVSDTGPGMDEETRQRAFLPYEQGALGMNGEGGIGLGLSICKQLVELHGGELTAESSPGKGSAFRFTLPLADPAERIPSKISGHEFGEGYLEAAVASLPADASPDERGDPASNPAFEAGKANVLAVDDDPVNLKVLAGILEAEAYNVRMATSGREALERLNSEPWDLIIADVMMPQMSGYELTQKIRERFSVSELPVLLLTARSEPADIQAGFLAGANDYVAKPVDALELKSRIRALTDLKQSVGERLRMEAAYLQAQIHPHFLFNALNSIIALSDVDTERMRNLGNAFTSYLRISFDFLNSGKLVSLSHELELVRAYLYVEKERFEDRLNIEWELDADVKPLLPPLTIQPLVENAVRHGVRSRSAGGTVRIRIARKENAALIEISDNGRGMDPETVRHLLDRTNKGGGIGLYNTNRRLKQLYGRGLTVHSRPNEGTTVSFVVPGR